MVEIVQAALLLRGEIRCAESEGKIKGSVALGYIDTLHKIESALLALKKPS